MDLFARQGIVEVAGGRASLQGVGKGPQDMLGPLGEGLPLDGSPSLCAEPGEGGSGNGHCTWLSGGLGGFFGSRLQDTQP